MTTENTETPAVTSTTKNPPVYQCGQHSYMVTVDECTHRYRAANVLTPDMVVDAPTKLDALRRAQRQECVNKARSFVYWVEMEKPIVYFVEKWDFPYENEPECQWLIRLVGESKDYGWWVEDSAITADINTWAEITDKAVDVMGEEIKTSQDMTHGIVNNVGYGIVVNGWWYTVDSDYNCHDEQVFIVRSGPVGMPSNCVKQFSVDNSADLFSYMRWIAPLAEWQLWGDFIA